MKEKWRLKEQLLAETETISRHCDKIKLSRLKDQLCLSFTLELNNLCPFHQISIHISTFWRLRMIKHRKQLYEVQNLFLILNSNPGSSICHTISFPPEVFTLAFWIFISLWSDLKNHVDPGEAKECSNSQLLPFASHFYPFPLLSRSFGEIVREMGRERV